MQDKPTSEQLYTTAAGDHVARKGDEAKRLRPGEQPPHGWHLMTQAEFEQEADMVVIGAAHETIGNAYRHITPGNPPPGYHEGSATLAELQAAGFHGDTKVEPKPGTPPADELLAAGQTVEVGRDEARSILAGATFRVLRDPSGKIVATWDEGRWWTPEESAAFTAALVAELEGDA